MLSLSRTRPNPLYTSRSTSQPRMVKTSLIKKSPNSRTRLRTKLASCFLPSRSKKRA